MIWIFYGCFCAFFPYFFSSLLIRCSVFGVRSWVHIIISMSKSSSQRFWSGMMHAYKNGFLFPHCEYMCSMVEWFDNVRPIKETQEKRMTTKKNVIFLCIVNDKAIKRERERECVYKSNKKSIYFIWKAQQIYRISKCFAVVFYWYWTFGTFEIFICYIVI